MAYTAPEQPTAPIYSNVEQIVRDAANKYGISEDYFVSIAKCESTLNPNAVNYGYYAGGGNPSGLFQYLPETWNRLSNLSGIYGDIWDATSQAELTAWAFANGHSGEWECR